MGLPVILIFLASDQRIPLRPEVFGFFFLAGQWALLAGPGFGPKRAIGVVLLQVLAANFHSYFLLGIGLSGAMTIEAWWQWFTCGQQGRADGRSGAAVEVAGDCHGRDHRGVVLQPVVRPRSDYAH